MKCPVRIEKMWQAKIAEDEKIPVEDFVVFFIPEIMEKTGGNLNILNYVSWWMKPGEVFLSKCVFLFMNGILGRQRSGIFAFELT